MIAVDFLNSFIADIPANLGYLSRLAAGMVGLILALCARSFDVSGWPMIALALYGVFRVVEHPVCRQAERLGSSIRVVAALGRFPRQTPVQSGQTSDDVRRRRRGPPSSSGP